MGKLNFFLHPRSIAVIGASAVDGKVGNAVLKNIIGSEYKGKIYPINPKPGTIMGLESYPSVSAVDGDIDVAVICIPARAVVGAAEECGKKGVKGVIIVAAGFKEVGGEGIELERQLVDVCKKYNVRCVGPNVLGNITTAANMSFSARTPMKGKVAMLSQSGAMMTAVLDWADTQKIGFSHFISLGNKCDVDEVDFVEEISEDPDTSILILYLESVTNGDKFFNIVSKATKRKPVVILKSGISPAGKVAASSHTGALAGDDIAFDIAFKRCGVIRAKTMKELFDLSNLFDKVSIPRGDRFAILTNAGGPGIIATDAFEQYNVEFSHFTETTIKTLKESLPPEASIKNPVDIVGDARPKRFEMALDAIFQESTDICAGALVLVTPQSTTDPTAVADVLVGIHKKYPDRLMLTTFIGGDTMQIPRRIVESHNIPSYSFPEPAIHSLRSLIDYKHYLDEENSDNENLAPLFEVDDQRIDEIIKKAQSEKRQMLLPFEISEICSMYGIKCPLSRLASNKEEIAKIIEEIGLPVAMKIASPEIQHKMDCGGIQLNIQSVEEAEIAFTKIVDNAKERGPKNARIFGVEIQQMINSNENVKKTEVIIGMSTDPQWGPMLMVGAGGIYANYMKDVSFELAARYTKTIALKQLEMTKVFKILKGVRGEIPSDIDSLLDTMLKVAQFVRDHRSVREMDINPVWVFAQGEGALSLDIKVLV